MPVTSKPFRVGLTRDFLRADGTFGYGDIGLSLLDAQPGIVHEFLAEDTRELRADQVRDYDALLVLVQRGKSSPVVYAMRALP